MALEIASKEDFQRLENKLDEFLARRNIIFHVLESLHMKE